MSMIARNQTEKTEHLEFLFSHLWHGQTNEVLVYLKTTVKAKNPEKLQKLMTYIEKHQKEIIDYDKRKKAGKQIGLNPEPEDKDEVIQKQKYSSSKTKVGNEVVQNQSTSNNKAIKKVKKVIGSGRVEKACDNVIGKRQKHKAMSFRPLGSRSLAILKMVELNHKWLDIWGPKMAANDLGAALFG